jgi:hypothetical protein
MLLLTYIIQPWPPQDFGTLVDSQTHAKSYRPSGILLEAFTMYTQSVFDKDLLLGAKFTPVSLSSAFSTFDK